MKQKLLAALIQGWKSKLGLSDEVFERVASAVETFITSEEQIPTFVASAEPMLKMYQSETDRVRNSLSQRIKDLEAQLKPTPQPQPQPEPTPAPAPQPAPAPTPDISAIIAKAVADAVTPLTERLTAMETTDKIKAVNATAQSLFNANEYVKKYKDYAEDAFDRASTENNLSGNKMTAEELSQKALGYFNKTVARIGVDTSKPFDGNGSGEDAFDANFFKKAYEQSGRIPTTENEPKV
jgi:hypothetical protein